jgi:hypothetical protein
MSWKHLEKTLGKHWENLVKTLIIFQINPRKTLGKGKPWNFLGKIYGKP